MNGRLNQQTFTLALTHVKSMDGGKIYLSDIPYLFSASSHEPCVEQSFNSLRITGCLRNKPPNNHLLHPQLALGWRTQPRHNPINQQKESPEAQAADRGRLRTAGGRASNGGENERRSNGRTVLLASWCWCWGSQDPHTRTILSKCPFLDTPWTPKTGWSLVEGSWEERARNMTTTEATKEFDVDPVSIN